MCSYNILVIALAPGYNYNIASEAVPDAQQREGRSGALVVDGRYDID
jgi:hypothetical protein